MTVREAARRLGRAESTVQQMCKPGGSLRAEKVWTVVKRGGHRVAVLTLRIDAHSVRRVLARRAQLSPRGKR